MTLVAIGIILTGGGVVMIVQAGGSGEGLSIVFIVGIWAIFVLYAIGLRRWQQQYWSNTPQEYADLDNDEASWEALEDVLTERKSPLEGPLRAFARTLLRRQRGGRVELLCSQDVISLIRPDSPYIPVDARLPGWLGTGQAVLVTMGLMGTFVGLTLGLFDAIPYLSGPHPDPDAAMELLLGGARLAFSKSVAGMYWSVVWLFMFREAEQAYDEIFQDLATHIDRSLKRASTEALLVELLEEQSALKGEVGSVKDQLRSEGQAFKDQLGRLSGQAPQASVVMQGPGISESGLQQMDRLTVATERLVPMVDRVLIVAERGVDSATMLREALEGMAVPLSHLKGALDGARGTLTAMPNGLTGTLQASIGAIAGTLEGGSQKWGDSMATITARMDASTAAMGQVAAQVAKAGEALARSMGEARQVVQDFRTSGEGLSRSLAETDRAVAVAVRPMQDAVQTLSQVQHALQAERAAFEGLRQTMASQAQAVEGLLKQYEGLTGALSDQMGNQLEQVGGTLENLQRGYRVFHEQTLAGMDAYQKQLLEFLPELERRLQFPGYVKELEQAMVMEVESRKDLSEVLKRLGR